VSLSIKEISNTVFAFALCPTILLDDIRTAVNKNRVIVFIGVVLIVRVIKNKFPTNADFRFHGFYVFSASRNTMRKNPVYPVKQTLRLTAIFV
jgi:hypothetical protein